MICRPCYVKFAALAAAVLHRLSKDHAFDPSLELARRPFVVCGTRFLDHRLALAFRVDRVGAPRAQIVSLGAALAV